MDATPKTRKSLFEGLTRLLHLHRLPGMDKTGFPTPTKDGWKSPIPPVGSNPSFPPSKSPTPFPALRTALPSPPSTPTKPSKVSAPSPLKSTVSIPSTKTNSSSPRTISTPTGAISSAPLVSRTAIITDYDRIYELVKVKQSIKLDEIARVLALKEEKVARELQTLEDNAMVEVRYPAFGEPLIVYKKPEA